MNFITAAFNIGQFDLQEIESLYHTLISLDNNFDLSSDIQDASDGSINSIDTNLFIGTIMRAIHDTVCYEALGRLDKISDAIKTLMTKYEPDINCLTSSYQDCFDSIDLNSGLDIAVAQLLDNVMRDV